MADYHESPPLLLRDALAATGLPREGVGPLFRYLWRNARHELLLMSPQCLGALHALLRRQPGLEQGQNHGALMDYLAGREDADELLEAMAAPPLRLLPLLAEVVLPGAQAPWGDADEADLPVAWRLLDYAWPRVPPAALLSLPRACRPTLHLWLCDRSGLSPWRALLTWPMAGAPLVASRAHAEALLDLLCLRAGDDAHECTYRHHAHEARVAAALAALDPRRAKMMLCSAAAAAARARALPRGDHGTAPEELWQRRLLPREAAHLQALASGGGVSRRRGDDGPGVRRRAGPDWAALPGEVLERVLSHAGGRTHFVAACVCVRWRAALTPAPGPAWLRVLAEAVLKPAGRSPLPPAVQLAHRLLLPALHGAFAVQHARNAAALGHELTAELVLAGVCAHERSLLSADGGEGIAALRLEYELAEGRPVRAAWLHVAAVAPPGSPAAGALLRLSLQLHAAYPVVPPTVFLAGARGGPAPLTHGDVAAADGQFGHAVVPRQQMFPFYGMHHLLLHIVAALGDPPGCAPPDFVADSSEEAAARAAAHGVLPLRHALRHAAALLGTDCAGGSRDWPTLAQAVAGRARQCALLAPLRDALCHVIFPPESDAEPISEASDSGDSDSEPIDDASDSEAQPAAAATPPHAVEATLPQLRAAAWATCEAPARARLLRLLRWSRLLCYIGAGRPADLARPSALEAALAAELACADGDTEHHATLAAPASYWPDPAADVAAYEAHDAPLFASKPVRRRARFDLYLKLPAHGPPAPPAEAVAAAVASDEAALDAAEADWAAAAGLEPPDAAAAKRAAAGCARIPPLGRTWSPVQIVHDGGEGDSSTDDDDDGRVADFLQSRNLAGRMPLTARIARAKRRAALKGSLRRHALPMRRLAVMQLDAMAARCAEPRLPAFDLALLSMLANSAGPAAAEAALEAAAGATSCASLVQYVGLM